MLAARVLVTSKSLLDLLFRHGGPPPREARHLQRLVNNVEQLFILRDPVLLDDAFVRQVAERIDALLARPPVYTWVDRAARLDPNVDAAARLWKETRRSHEQSVCHAGFPDTPS